MKKALLYSIIICIFIILIKYSFSNYKMNYKVDNYSISMTYKSGRFYFEISDDNYKYNFDIYSKRNITKSKIKKIKTIEEDNLKCIYPEIKGMDTYPLCYKDGIFTDYHLIDSDVLDIYKEENVNVDKSSKDFIYYNTLNDEEYIAIWNYKGYIVINGNNYNNVELFNKDKYDNSLAYIIGDTVYMPDNNQEHEFTNLVGLNLTDLSNEIFDIGYTIDYDSYVVGSIDDKLYIFDNKYSILYEIDVKDYSANIIGNNEKGFVKYENGKFVSCSKSEYKINKIKYNTKESIYSYEIDNNKVFKTISDNKEIKQNIINKNIKIMKEYKNKIYYSVDDMFYTYDPKNGSREVFYNYEMKFNNDNNIFIYNK